MNEEWRAICGGSYEASSLGRIRRAVAGKGTSVGRIICGAMDRVGYPTVCLHADGAQKTMLRHRLIAEALHGPCPYGREVNHKDGDKTNNRADNLEYVTRRQNMQHAADTGLQVHPRGAAHPLTRFTPGDVLEIRAARARGVTGATLARLYGVAPTTIYAVANGQNWGHLKGGVA